MLVTREITVAAGAGAVWQVLTDPAQIRVWVSDADLAVFADWRVGGELRYGGDWHGHPIDNRGEILAVVPGETLRYSFWSSLSQRPDAPEHRSIIVIELTASDATTDVRVTQDNLPDEATYGHVNFYWAMALDRIRRLAEGGKL